MKSLILRFHPGGQSILFTYKNKQKHQNRKIRDSREEIHKHSILEIGILRFACLGARCVAKTIRNAGRANRKIKMLLMGRPAPPCPPSRSPRRPNFHPTPALAHTSLHQIAHGTSEVRCKCVFLSAPPGAALSFSFFLFGCAPERGLGGGGWDRRGDE